MLIQQEHGLPFWISGVEVELFTALTAAWFKSKLSEYSRFNFEIVPSDPISTYT